MSPGATSSGKVETATVIESGELEPGKSVWGLLALRREKKEHCRGKRSDAIKGENRNLDCWFATAWRGYQGSAEA